MAVVFRLPDLGEGLHEAELVTWHVGVGDHVVADQPLCSVETDKAVVEVPSPQSGEILKLCAEPGAIVGVGEPLVEFDGHEEVHEEPDAGSVLDLPRVTEQQPRAEAGRPRAAPAVRRLAASLGVDLERIDGSGPHGTITKADVEAVAGREGVAEELRGVRRAMMLNMSRAGREVVPATVTDEADIEVWPAGTDMTIRLVRAVAAGCRASPALNAWFDSDAGTLRLHPRIDLAIAVDTEDGLFAPVIRNIGERDAEDLRHGLEAMKADVARRSIPRHALSGATFTLSNFGMFGGRFASLVVIPPQVAILGAGRAEVRVVAREGQASLRRLLPLSLSFDHRVVTGTEATKFLNAAIDDLEVSE